MAAERRYTLLRDEVPGPTTRRSRPRLQVVVTENAGALEYLRADGTTALRIPLDQDTGEAGPAHAAPWASLTYEAGGGRGTLRYLAGIALFTLDGTALLLTAATGPAVSYDRQPHNNAEAPEEFGWIDGLQDARVHAYLPGAVLLDEHGFPLVGWK